MLTLTDAAQKHIANLLATRQDEGLAIHLKITGRRSVNFEYEFGFTYEKDRAQDDTMLDFGAFRLYIDADSVAHLDGATIDYNSLGKGGFKIENPNSVWETPLAQAVADVIENKINPGVAMHGGYVTLVDVRDDVAFITMGGGCQGCGLANVTLKQGIDKMIREAVPGIHKIVDTTHHAEGSNPFYSREAAGQESPLA